MADGLAKRLIIKLLLHVLGCLSDAFGQSDGSCHTLHNVTDVQKTCLRLNPVCPRETWATLTARCVVMRCMSANGNGDGLRERLKRLRDRVGSGDDEDLGPDRGTMDQLEARRERARMEAREEARREQRQERIDEAREEARQEVLEGEEDSEGLLASLGEVLEANDGDDLMAPMNGEDPGEPPIGEIEDDFDDIDAMDGVEAEIDLDFPIEEQN